MINEPRVKLGSVIKIFAHKNIYEYANGVLVKGLKLWAFWVNQSYTIQIGSCYNLWNEEVLLKKALT